MNALFFIALCLIWGSTWMAIKINLLVFPPFYSAGLRFMLAAAGVYALAGVYIKKHSTADPLAAVTVQMFWTALILLAVAVPVEFNHKVAFAILAGTVIVNMAWTKKTMGVGRTG